VNPEPDPERVRAFTTWIESVRQTAPGVTARALLHEDLVATLRRAIQTSDITTVKALVRKALKLLGEAP
jgi:hypothetical protein